MEPNSYRPRVSRETRLLLTAGLLAIVSLWVLARIRFPDRPVSNPVPSFLPQLAAGPTYDELALQIAQVQPRLEPLLLLLDLGANPDGIASAGSPRAFQALRLRDDLAVAVLPLLSDGTSGPGTPSVLARDPGTGLTVLRVSTRAVLPSPPPWAPLSMRQPRYLVSSDAARGRVVLRPVFVATLDPIDSALWPDRIWALPASRDLTPGSFLFTSSAQLAGAVIQHDEEPAIVPAHVLIAEAERLLAEGGAAEPAGSVGIEVQALSPGLSTATGASAGVVVTFVSREGIAAGRLMVGDVVETANGVALAGLDSWHAVVSHLSAGSHLVLQVRRRGAAQQVDLVAPPAPTAARAESLGLTLRPLPSVGAEVIRVEPGSAAARAGVVVGDRISLMADVDAPTPEQIEELFSSAPSGRPVLMAITRGDRHHVVALPK